MIMIIIIYSIINIIIIMAVSIIIVIIIIIIFKRSDLEIHETRNMSDRNRRFGASCAIIKVT